jgi:hypothetical protein
MAGLSYTEAFGTGPHLMALWGLIIFTVATFVQVKGGIIFWVSRSMQCCSQVPMQIYRGVHGGSRKAH